MSVGTDRLVDRRSLAALSGRATDVLQGSLMSDCQATLFCAPCVLCQMWRELDAVGWHA